MSSKALTYSGTGIYGWKRNDNLQWGLGVSRTYRAGQLLHIPVVFYNRTFSPQWGVRGHFSGPRESAPQFRHHRLAHVRLRD